MKKVLLVLISLVLLVGCGKQVENPKEESVKKEEQFVLKKKDSSKDYINLNKIREVLVDNKIYILNNLDINIVSSDVDNINLEIKTFVNNANKNYVIENNKLINGYIIDYDYYINDEYLSVILKYYYYVDGIIGEENDNVYNISLKTGKVISDKELLSNYDLTEEELFTKLEKTIISDDVLYAISSIKNNGYKLFVNNDKKLKIIYYELNDEKSIRKELELN